MKTSLFMLALAGFLTIQAFAAPVESPRVPTRKLPVSMEQQLANCISYPDVLKQTQQPGVVVIQFKINADSELAQLKVFSQNEELNNDLLRQLTGKKLAGCGNDPAEVYTVRLRFQP